MSILPFRVRVTHAALLTTAAFAWAAEPAAETLPADVSNQLQADLHMERRIIQAGQPVWVTFTLTNLGSTPICLKVPGVPSSDPPTGDMGLPVVHVFSGLRYNGVSIRDARGEEWDQQVEVRPAGQVPMVRIAPNGCVGARIELTQYFRSLKRAGKYTLVWRPYSGAVESPPLHLTLLAARQAVINTDFGTMTMRFYYDEAPHAVENFIELVEQQFYDGLTFHKIVPYSLVQGGDPRADGRGVRPDGKRLRAEFSRIPFETGTVGMARIPKDPDSASCQFFICVTRQPSFDGNETAFGYLVGEQSFETLKNLASVPTDSHYRPLRTIRIRSINLENILDAPENSGPVTPEKPLATRPSDTGLGPRRIRGLSQIDRITPATRPSVPLEPRSEARRSSDEASPR